MRFLSLVWPENCLSLTDFSAFTGFGAEFFICIGGASLNLANVSAAYVLSIHPDNSIKLSSSGQTVEIFWKLVP